MDKQRSKATFLHFICLPTYLLFASAVYLVIYFTGFVFVSHSINFITVFIAVALTVKDWIYRTIDGGKFPNVLYPYMPLIALGFIIIRLMSTTTHVISFNIMIVVIMACGLIMFLRCTQKTKRKTVLGVVYSLLVAFVFLIASMRVFLFFVWMPPGGVEQNRISELSPNGAYIIEAVQRSEGALGGSTTVTVQRTARFNLLLGELQFRPIQVHRGGWGEFFHIENIRWDGNNRFYMHRSVYRDGEIYTFELVGFRWSRVD